LKEIFILPESIDSQNVRVEYRDGFLETRFDKKEGERSKVKEIRIGIE
jgi:HSP20 family molecular chaperone IbpA